MLAIHCLSKRPLKRPSKRSFVARQLALIALLPVFLSGCELLQRTPSEPDPVAVKLDDLERRLAAMERVIASGSLIDLTVQVDELERENAELLGRVQTLENATQNTGGRQRDLYVDLDDRMRLLEAQLQQLGSQQAANGAAATPSEQLPLPGASDRDNYQAAFELLKEQRYEDAGNAFQQFLVNFPDSQLADNAQYWLAESYYVTNRFEDALERFESVLNDFPNSRKTPDALLKIGYSNYELERWDAAKLPLERVSREFPDSTAARLADQRLQRMESENR